MNQHIHRTWQWLPNVAGIFSFLTVVFVGLMIYDTLTDTLIDNIEMEPAVKVTSWMEGTTFVVMYERGFTIHRNRAGVVYRTVVCPPQGAKYFLDAPPIRREFEAKYYPALKRPISFILDKPLPVGSKCQLRVEGEWKGGMFAISSRRFLLDVMEFTVGEKP